MDALWSPWPLVVASGTTMFCSDPPDLPLAFHAVALNEFTRPRHQLWFALSETRRRACTVAPGLSRRRNPLPSIAMSVAGPSLDRAGTEVSSRSDASIVPEPCWLG